MKWHLAILTVLTMLAACDKACGQTPAQAAPVKGAAGSAAVAAAAETQPSDLGRTLTGLHSMSKGSGFLQGLALVTLLAVAPAILVLVTSFTRIIVVLGLLRQALATASLPPNQVLFGLALLMTVVVMAPVYKDIHRDAVAPYSSGQINADQALAAGERHVRGFMIQQIEAGKNSDDVYLFLDGKAEANKDLTWGDVPTLSLLPAFVVSELKIAFLIGFQIYLPFVIIDMLVSTVLVSMGMLMLPPVMVSLPFKLLLFVLANGWNLVVGTLMRSFG